MPAQFSSNTFRIVDGQIPAVRAAVEESLIELRDQLFRLRQEGVIEQWLGDPVSENVVLRYNDRVMGGVGGDAAPGSAYGALVAYQAELVKIKESLELMEQGYAGAEGDTRGNIEATYRAP